MAILDEWVKLPNIECGTFAGGIRKSLGDHGPAATLAIDETHLVSRRLQELHCGFTNIGIVVVDERVVEENHFSIGTV